MTREEIIRNLKYTIEKHKNDTVNTFDTNISVMCKDILDYLEQEPSGDLISRIKHAIYKVCLSEGNKDIFVKILDEINKLPSVKQEPKTGHWIEHPTEEDYSVCSRCGIGSRRMEHGKNADGTKYIDIYSYRFCPYCGARMVEPQESEDKECGSQY